MGCGNVCVSGKYEGLYYIDNDDIHVYRRDDPFADEPETTLLKELGSADINTGKWIYDEVGTMEEEGDILECFIDSFNRMFPSFRRTKKDRWIRNGWYGDFCRRVIMENGLFYIAVEDNEWSLAVELLQKGNTYEDGYLSDGGRLEGLQAKHFQRYLDGMKLCLLERLPSIGTRTGPWTSGVIRRDLYDK